MLWKVAGGLLVAWLAFMVVGSIIGLALKVLFWGAVIAGVLWVGTAAYRAVTGSKSPRQIRS